MVDRLLCMLKVEGSNPSVSITHFSCDFQSSFVTYTKNCKKCHVKRLGAEEAHRAHNPRVRRSKLRAAKNISFKFFFRNHFSCSLSFVCIDSSCINSILISWYNLFCRGSNQTVKDKNWCHSMINNHITQVYSHMTAGIWCHIKAAWRRGSA